MNRLLSHMRLAIGLLLCASGSLALAQSPRTPPTTQAGTIAEVVYTRGQLEITADNSSLNQILRGIARQTGMKITGSVLDERVYGTYGPATPAQVLSTLLAGMGTNMLLRESATGAPVEIVLAPRLGGPTLPPLVSPSAAPAETQARAQTVGAPVAGPGTQQGSTGGPSGPGAQPAPLTPEQMALRIAALQEKQRQYARH